MRASRRATAVLMANKAWDQAHTVALFHSISSEVSTEMLIQSALRTGRRVALPVTPPLGQPLEFRLVTPSTPLVRAHFGALEPGPTATRVDYDAIALVVTAGLGFDRRGGRLGYGGGYYDRTQQLTGPGVLLAFACQQVDRIPEEAHDIRVRGIVTESGWLTPLSSN